MKKLRKKYRSITIFQFGDCIVSDINIIDKINVLDYFIENKININQKQVNYIDISLKKALNDEKIEKYFLRYTGERIAVALRNREDNYIVYEEYGKNVYQATSPELDDKFGIIHVHRGFRYKPIILKTENSIGVIIEPKSKFFSEMTLRDLWEQKRIDYNTDKNTEKICCESKCPDYLNPYGTCELNYPSFFSNIRDLKFIKEKPSETTINIIDFYKKENICPTNLICNKIIDEIPIIHKIFWNKPDKIYSYPLEIIRIVPDTSDAGSDAKSLMRKIQPKPFERFKLIKEEYMNVISNISDSNFQIISEDILDEQSSDIVKLNLQNPSYLLKNNFSTDFPSIEYNEKGFYEESCKDKDQITFHLLHFKSDKSLNMIENILKSKDSMFKNIETYTSFSKIKNIRCIRYRIRDFDDFLKIIKNESSTVYNFYILISDYEHFELHNDVKSYLIRNDKPNQTINLDTLNNLGYGSLRSLIYLQMYLKSEGKTWILEEVFRVKDIIIGLNVKFYKDHIISTILFFTNQGNFIKGYYLNENVEVFNEKLLNLLKEQLSKYETVFILTFGSITHNIIEKLEGILKDKNYSIVSVKYNSLIRLFEQDDNKKWLIYPPKPGYGIMINNESFHIITSKTKIGTPSCIKVKILSSKSKNKIELLQTLFKFTRFNPALVKNETKLPFPLHFARATLHKGIQYTLDSFCFKIPFYL